MPVLTEKEYRESKKIKADRVNEIKSINPIKPEIKKQEISKTIYVLQYPEIPMYGTVNFESHLIVNGKDVKYECIDGLVKTMSKELSDFLVKNREYSFVKEVIQDECSNNNTTSL